MSRKQNKKVLDFTRAQWGIYTAPVLAGVACLDGVFSRAPDVASSSPSPLRVPTQEEKKKQFLHSLVTYSKNTTTNVWFPFSLRQWLLT